MCIRDRRKYIDYYEMVLARLSGGGYIIADNTLWDGHVLEEQPHRTDPVSYTHLTVEMVW